MISLVVLLVFSVLSLLFCFVYISPLLFLRLGYGGKSRSSGLRGNGVLLYCFCVLAFAVGAGAGEASRFSYLEYLL
jgi:hypothetical protein